MKYIQVGTIVGTHGIKGEVKVKSDTSFKEERYKKGNILYIDFNNQMIEIEINSFREHKTYDLITFNNLNNINDVLKYINCKIYVDKDTLSSLNENEYYYEDIIGSKIFDEKNNLIGDAVDITELPHGLLLVVKTKKGESLIPFVVEFIKSIDVENKKIVVSLIEGLL